ncbi:MAG TPA: hypothetical protein VF188_00500 [Longimicrobiales bacterium]
MVQTKLGRTAALLMVLGACRGVNVESEPQPAAQPAPPTAAAVPAGTLIRVQLNQTLSTRSSRVGQPFTATVVEPLVARNGQTVIPRGSRVRGVVTGLDRSERLGEQAAIRLDLQRIEIRGRSYPLSAEIVDADVERRGPRELGEHAAIGGVAGAALGAIIGGDLADVLIGGALGAGAGTIISLGLGDVDAELPAGTAMTLRTTRTISLR